MFSVDTRSGRDWEVESGCGYFLKCPLIDNNVCFCHGIFLEVGSWGLVEV